MSGTWENKYAVMSDADPLEYESASAVQRLSKSYLMIRSDNSFLPNTARRQFEMVKTRNGRGINREPKLPIGDLLQLTVRLCQRQDADHDQ